MNKKDFTHPLPYALHLLEVLNRSTVNGLSLSQFNVEGYAVWQWYQSLLFDELSAYAQRSMGATGAPRAVARGGVLTRRLRVVVSVALTLLATGWTLIRRPRLLVYTVDKVQLAGEPCDARMVTIYEFLRREHLSYLEVYHATFGSGFYHNILRRRRIGLYLEAIDSLYSMFSFFARKRTDTEVSLSEEGLTHDEHRFVEQLIRKYVRRIDQARFRYRYLAALVRYGSFRALFTIDDPRHYNEILLACEKRGAPSYAFQHGHFTPYHVGWRRMLPGTMLAPSHFLVWSPFWKQELGRLDTYMPTDRIEVGGIRRVPEVTPVIKPEPLLSLIVPYELGAPKQEVSAILQTLLDSGEVEVYFKTRGDISNAAQMADYGLKSHPRLIVTHDLNRALEHGQVVVGTNSTFLYDAVGWKIPVAILKNLAGLGEWLVSEGFATLIDTDADIVAQLRRVAQTPADVLLQRFKTLMGSPPIFLKETLNGLKVTIGL